MRFLTDLFYLLERPFRDFNNNNNILKLEFLLRFFPFKKFASNRSEEIQLLCKIFSICYRILLKDYFSNLFS